MQLDPSKVHVWSIDLNIDTNLEKEFFSLLNPEERIRAHRLRTPFHRKRFIAARGALRELLGRYLDMPPELIEFQYNEHKKPDLLNTNIPLFFNITHCRDQALAAFTYGNRVGIDLEKVREKYNLAVAERYFSKDENLALMHLPNRERTTAFYRLWARKEAVVKAIGKGMSYPMATFTVSVEAVSETIDVAEEKWYLAPLVANKGFEAAIATKHPIQNLLYHHFESCKNTTAGL